LVRAPSTELQKATALLSPQATSLCERRPVPGLIGRAGPGRPAAQRLVGAHQPLRHPAAVRIGTDAAGMQQIERTDIEGRRHGDRAAAATSRSANSTPLSP